MYHRLVLAVAAVAGLALLAIAWAAPAPPAPEPLAAKFSKRVKFEGIDDPKATLSDALDKLAKQFDLTFDVNEKAFKFEQVMDVLKTEVANPNPLPPMKNVRLDTVLRKLLGRVPVPSGATYLIRQDHVEITTNTFVTPEVWGGVPNNVPRLPLVWATLDKVPLEDALKDLAEQADFNVLLDNRVAEKGKTPVSARLRNTPLDTAVRLLADMADLRPVHLDNVLYVTTKEKAAMMDARLKKEKGEAGIDPVTGQPLNPLDDNSPEGLNQGAFRKGGGRNIIINVAPAGAMP
jgi:hypothetical protein